MTLQVKIQILKTAATQEYQLAINGTLLNGTQIDSNSILVSTDQLASVLSKPVLAAMVDSKNCAQQNFVSNKELSEWLQAKEGRRCVVVYPQQMIKDGRSYNEWNYSADASDCKASDGFQIFIAEAGSNNLYSLTRNAIGLK